MKEDKTVDIRKAVIIGLAIFAIVFLVVFGSVKTIEMKRASEGNCIKYGGTEHKLRYMVDQKMAREFMQNGEELGPYFNYKFCEEKK